MRKQIICIVLTLMLGSSFATNNNVLLTADKAFSTNKIGDLAKLYQTNYKDPIVAYLYSKAMLTYKNEPTYAEDFITRMPNSYMENDLLHQLLGYYYTKQSYANYQKTYNLLYNTQISPNETCGYDIANIKLNPNHITKTDNNWLINNNVPDWCSQLTLLLYNRQQISKASLHHVLINLSMNGDNSFNQIASQVKIKPLKFSIYQNVQFKKLPPNQYIQAFYIVNIAKKYPDNALKMLNSLAMEKSTRSIIANYIAMRFATNQEFKNAISLYEKYKFTELSDDESEWKARSYLALGKWSALITTINNMPQNLQDKNVWLYWKAKAYDGLNQSANANVYLLKIEKDYSYYSMLAQGELGSHTVFYSGLPDTPILKDDKFTNRLNKVYNFYKLAQSNNANSLKTIATYEWYYLTRVADPQQIKQMSVIASNSADYILSISAAHKIDPRYIELSFPTPYLSAFETYASLMRLDSAYPLAISRQESRFNASVIAFDGGEGLMQIMPQTAKYIFRKTKFMTCSRLNYTCNIKLGTWYLGSLYQKFGSFIYATAGYNAGPNRAKRWQNNLMGMDNRIQIELIPIPITRDYVQKVLTNKAIYDNKLNHKSTVNLLTYITSLKDAPANNNILNDDNTDASKL